MGSVSDSVIRHAHCPLLVVRREGEEVVEAHSGLTVRSGGDANLDGGVRLTEAYLLFQLLFRNSKPPRALGAHRAYEQAPGGRSEDEPKGEVHDSHKQPSPTL